MGGEVGPEVGPAPLVPLSTYQSGRENKRFFCVWAGSVLVFLVGALAGAGFQKKLLKLICFKLA